MKTPYIPPTTVTSPRQKWILIKVLVDEGEGGTAIAVGRWEDKPVLAIRWNGDEEGPVGTPQSRGLATWFIIPEGKYTEAIFGTLDETDKAFVRPLIPPPH